MRELIIHYYREDQDYEPWAIWIWPEGYGGQWVIFEAEDDYGKIARFKVSKEHRRLGFLVRGASWEKDLDQDRYFNSFIGDRGEMWLIAGDPEVYLVPPVHLRKSIRPLENLEISFHYHRYDEDYTDSKLWIWLEGEEGRNLEFTSRDDYGLVAKIALQGQTDGNELGFIIRKGGDGNWVKDGDFDRYLPFYRTDHKGKLAVWLLQNDPKLYYQAQDVDREPRLLKASLDALSLIRVETHLPLTCQGAVNLGFELKTSTGEKIELTKVVPLGQSKVNRHSFALYSVKPLKLRERYILQHQTHGECAVSFGQIYASKEFEEEFHYGGSDLGVTYTTSQTTFKVWSPTAEDIKIAIYNQDQGGQARVVPLSLGLKGVWKVTLKGNLEGLYYNFLVSHNSQEVEVVDPYARAVGANGKRGQIVNLSKTNPPGFENLPWLPLDNSVDAVIYEVHVRDFSSSKTSGIKHRGKYLGLTERGTTTQDNVVTGLDHLKKLGVTHVHLLPIFDFATVDELKPDGDYNWGYDPLNYNAPEGSYASDPRDGRVRIRELKELILALNQAGLGVIMDVVYNHTYESIASNLNRLVPSYYYRLHQDGRFSNGSGCGNELADERSMVRKLIVDSILYWAQEYKLAGFRFDLMGLHEIKTMTEIKRALDDLNPQYLVYGEGWAAAASTLPEEKRAVKQNTSKLLGIASFCSDFRDGIKGHVFQTREGGFIQGAGYKETVKFGIVGAIFHDQIDYNQVLYSNAPWALEPSQSVSYVEAHDNLTLWDKLLCTTKLDARDERVDLMKLAHALILTSQGIPFLHAGQEFARTKGGDPNSYQSPDHVNQLDWDRKAEFKGLYEYTRGLIKLRKERPAFRMARGGEVREKLRFWNLASRQVLGYSLGPHANGDSYETILVFFNASLDPVELAINKGPWQVLATKDQVGGELGEIQGPNVYLEARSTLILARR